MEGLRHGLDVLAAQLRKRQSHEGLATRDKLIEDRAKRIDVRAAIYLGASVARDFAPLLRRHVIGRAQDLTRDRQGRGPGTGASSAREVTDFCYPQVQKLDCDLPVGGLTYHYVFGLEVAVDHALRVRGVEDARNRLKGLEGVMRRKAPALLELRIERAAFYELHDHVGHTVRRRAKIVDLDGVRMAETARGLSFAAKAAQPLGVIAHLRRQNLNGHAIAQEYVARAKDRSHAAFAEHGFYVVLAVKGRVDDSCGVVLQHFAVSSAEALAIFVLGIT